MFLKDYATRFTPNIFEKKHTELCMSHSPIETQCVIFESLYDFQPISKKKKKRNNILAYRYISRGLQSISTCSNYSINEAICSVICDILMKIPILKNTGKLYLKMHWKVFIKKSSFYIMHIISRTIFFAQNAFPKKLLPGNLLW